MKDVFWSLFGMASVAEVAGRGWHFSPYPIPFPFGEKAGLMLLLLIVQQAIDPHFFLASSLPHTSLPSAYEL